MMQDSNSHSFPVPDRYNPEAVTLYRERAQERLLRLNPYYDEGSNLVRGLLDAADEVRSMFYHGQPAAQEWERFAVAMLNLAKAAESPESHAERLTNATTDLRSLAGIEPAVPPFRQPGITQDND